MAVIPSVALTNTFDTWRTRSNEAFARLNQFAIDESKLYANTLTANTSFLSKGLGTFNGRVTIGTNLNVSGNTTIGAAGKVANVTGWFGVTGRATVSTNLFVAGNVGIGTAAAGGTLNVLSNASGAVGIDVLGRSADNISTIRLLSTNGGTNYGQIRGSAGSIDLQAIANIPVTFYTNNTERMRIASGGLITACNSMTVTQNLTVSGNTTLNGTTTDRSNALNQTLTDAATISWDVSSGRVATVTLGASRTFGAPTNLKVGTYILSVIQGGSGSYTLTWNGVFKWPAGVAPSLTTTVGARDLFTFYSDGTNLYGSYLPDVK